MRMGCRWRLFLGHKTVNASRIDVTEKEQSFKAFFLGVAYVGVELRAP